MFTDDRAKEFIFASLAIAVLLGFAGIFAFELYSGLSAESTAAIGGAEVERPRVYVATLLSALVGGVAAVFLGVEMPRAGAWSEWRTSDKIRILYVIVYALFGLAAIGAWFMLEQATSLSLRNLAVTFLGLLMPAVSGYLGGKSTESGGGE